MKQTQNYQLSQWDKTDRIQMEDFNGDNSKVDAALKTLANQVASKANSSTVSSLTTKVNTKAAQSDLTAAVNRISALESGKADKTALTAEQTAREAADTALRNENCWVKLSDKTLSAAASSYTWAIKNPENYAELRCVFELACTGEVHFNVQNGASLAALSGDSPVTSHLMLGGNNANGAGGFIRLSPAGGSGNVLIYYEIAHLSDNSRLFFPTGRLAGVSQLYKNLSTVKIFSENGTFLAGSRFILYGLKK